MEPGPGAAGAAFPDAGSCPGQPSGARCGGRGGGAAHVGHQQEWAGVNTRTHSRHGIAGMGLGGSWSGQDQTVLNSFSLKSVLGLQVFFLYFLVCFFFKKLRERAGKLWSPGMVASHASCAFPLGPPSGGAGVGGRLPVNILDLGRVGGWCWAKPGVPGWRSGCPSRHRSWQTQHVLPSPVAEQDKG